MIYFFVKERMIQVVMFLLTITFLSLASVLIEYLQTEKTFFQLSYSRNMIELLVILWIVFFIERLLSLVFCQKKTWEYYLGSLLIIIFPPVRLATRRCGQEEYIWWNFTWQKVDLELCYRVEKRFMFPILVISLLMLPFWIVDFFLPQQIDDHLFLFHILHMGNALIWGAFVAEFIMMFSITSNRFKYLRSHWLEIFIILLPMVVLIRWLAILFPALNSGSFLTPVRLLWFSKFKRMLNIYRSRSFLNRMVRIMIMIDVIRYYYSRRNPEKYLQILQLNLREKEQEIIELKNKIRETEELLCKERIK